MSTALVIGASGLVGGHLLTSLRYLGRSVVGTCYPEPVPGLVLLDMRDQAAVKSVLVTTRPEIVYLPAALTNVDYCELHPQESYEVNVLGTAWVAQAVYAMGARLVFFSSDYIFDGRQGPYRETDPAFPICEYGRQKLIGEHYLATNFPPSFSLIVRTTVVYGWERQGKNFVQRLVQTLQKGQTLKVPFDQIGNPTYAPNLAAAVVELAEANLNGVYHVVGAERVSRYEFACQAATVFGLDPALILPVSTAELGQVAPRPLNAGLIIEKTLRVIKSPLVTFREGLVLMSKTAGEYGLC